MKRKQQPQEQVRAPKTVGELQYDYEMALKSAFNWIENLRVKGEQDRLKVVAKMALRNYDFLYEFGWGNGVESALEADLAERLLNAAIEIPLERLLAYEVDEFTRKATRAHYSGTSSNPFSNALELSRSKVEARWLERCQMWLREIRSARAKLEYVTL